MARDSSFDVLVIGGGHAGTEAALAAARMGCRTLLVTHSLETVGQMSCNPAIGGIGKSHLVREIDALDGAMARAADQAGIHFRTLNASKGPAVRATRAQTDRSLYRAAIQRAVQRAPNLSLFQGAVSDLLVKGDAVRGALLNGDIRIEARATALCAGTFLGGVIHVGERRRDGGRAGAPSAGALAARLRELPLRVGRLKTGTPPRLDARTVRFDGLEEQPGDVPRPVMSFLGDPEQHPPQRSCHITHTSERAHEIIRANLHRSPMYSGRIEGRGPRYCPSIEDKVVRFAERSSHQIFIEPEGLDSLEVYPNGISTSLPFAVQQQMVHSIRGFEEAHIVRPGYAIEYDYFDPRDLAPDLSVRCLSGLYFAGQINGTTGYEEAGAQGLLAGCNAARHARGQPPWQPRRDEAYLGVMIDDLNTRGVTEPYRMFTSRAEYRLLLREDNADWRLTEQGRRLGLVGERRWRRFCEKREAVETEKARLSGALVRPGSPAAQALEKRLPRPLTQEVHLDELLRRPELRYRDLREIDPDCIAAGQAADQVEAQIKYAGYIRRQEHEIAALRNRENTRLPESLEYREVRGLSVEAQQKLSEVQPRTLGQAARIEGVTPAALSLLLIHLRKQSGERAPTRR